MPTRALIGEAYDEIERLRNIIYDLNSRLSKASIPEGWKLVRDCGVCQHQGQDRCAEHHHLPEAP